ncbi:ABC transporter substrate-binding protein [Microbacterium testaceum]|uniref:ABC transporter substrate-binding protein n=1 Tax=Microbacterium testaceum TaxID=2033 RepID=A0A147EXL2_MICTE|nr:anchored repeat ABC transporter, substrate-binding protein [Microbacterium testaceum]KTR94755.1 ABC transporter substrate-binding protein [Microbacterium testaceum]
MLLIAAALAVTGCAGPPSLAADRDRLRVVTTTGILRDLVRNVGGDRVDVVSLVPDRADPHAYEPTLRDARNVVYADVAFSNYAMLEEQAVIKTLDANLRDDAVSVSLAEEAVKYAAEIIPLVEDVSLDTVWLGLRAHGRGEARGATRTSAVELSAVAASGPGAIVAYLTGSFGSTERYIDSSDGFNAADGYRDDTVTLPADAHTHLSWAFTEPGVYTLTLRARLQVDDTAKPVDLGEATYTFAVGVDPHQAATDAGLVDPVVLDRGHADLTVDVDAASLGVRYDPSGGGDHTQRTLPADGAIVEVPAKARTEIPAGEDFRFLGRPGQPIYQLAQAVLGKHVHGEIDPHLWQDVRNALAYVQLIRDTLIGADPAHARDYAENARRYLAELDAVDAEVRAQYDSIPPGDRHLVTTHDAFGYLAHAYGLDVAGFVTPNPAVEPSLADRRRLADTIRTLHVPAVFLEPNLAARSSTLTDVADDLGIRVCPIYGDAFTDTVTTYVQLVRANAESVRSCLTPSDEGSR